MLYSGPYFDTMISQLIGRQEEMVALPDDSDMIHAFMNGNPKFDANQVVMLLMYLLTLPTHNSDRTMRNYKQMNLLPDAVSPEDAEEFPS